MFLLWNSKRFFQITISVGPSPEHPEAASLHFHELIHVSAGPRFAELGVDLNEPGWALVLGVLDDIVATRGYADLQLAVLCAHSAFALLNRRCIIVLACESALILVRQVEIARSIELRILCGMRQGFLWRGLHKGAFLRAHLKFLVIPKIVY